MTNKFLFTCLECGYCIVRGHHPWAEDKPCPCGNDDYREFRREALVR